MLIEVRVDRRACRRWHGALAQALARAVPGADVRLRAVESGDTPFSGVASLLALERLVLSGSRPSLCDPLDAPPGRIPDGEAALVVDCSGRGEAAPAGSHARHLRPLFDGAPGEGAMIACLLAGAMPEVAVEDVPSGAILGTARPSRDIGGSLTAGMEAVASRAITLLAGLAARPDVPPMRRSTPVQPRDPALARYVARSAVHAAVRAIYRLCFYAPHWRIGWRHLDGPGVIERGTLDGPAWSTLGDPGTSFLADPFPIVREGRCFVFCEQLDHRVGKGVIAAVPWGPAGPVGEPSVVLEEPWHLSYPFLVEHEGALFMVPESTHAGVVALYRCTDFPTRWERVATLLSRIEASDATIFPHDGRFWMTSSVRPGAGGYSDTLALHHAPGLFGPWEEHEARPALIDAASARPGGAVVRRQGTLWRPVQDCATGYGIALNLARIDVLDPARFAQTIVHRVAPGPAWPGKRLHTLNRCGRLECIDGSAMMPRFAPLRPAFAPHS